MRFMKSRDVYCPEYYEFIYELCQVFTRTHTHTHHSSFLISNRNVIKLPRYLQLKLKCKFPCNRRNWPRIWIHVHNVFGPTGECNGEWYCEQCMLDPDPEFGHPVSMSHIPEAPGQRGEPADQLGRPDQHLHVDVQRQCHMDDRLLGQRGRAQAHSLFPARVPHQERSSPLCQDD